MAKGSFSTKTTKDVNGRDIPVCKICGHGISEKIDDNSHSNGWGTIIRHA